MCNGGICFSLHIKIQIYKGCILCMLYVERGWLPLDRQCEEKLVLYLYYYYTVVGYLRVHPILKILRNDFGISHTILDRLPVYWTCVCVFKDSQPKSTLYANCIFSLWISRHIVMQLDTIKNEISLQIIVNKKVHKDRTTAFDFTF